MTNIPQKTCIKVKGLTLFTLLRVKEVKVLTLPHVSPFTLVDPRLPVSEFKVDERAGKADGRGGVEEGDEDGKVVRVKGSGGGPGKRGREVGREESEVRRGRWVVWWEAGG